MTFYEVQATSRVPGLTNYSLNWTGERWSDQAGLDREDFYTLKEAVEFLKRAAAEFDEATTLTVTEWAEDEEGEIKGGEVWSIKGKVKL